MKDDILFIGCDPGMEGYITFCLNNSYEHFQVPLNKDKNKIDFRKVFSKLDFYSHCCDPYFKDVVIYYEDVHSVFGMSAKSNFRFGGAVWSLEAIFICALGEPIMVQPKVWQEIMHQGIEKNKDKKTMSLKAAQKLFPAMDFKRTERCTIPDHNLIDSLLICEYGKRQYYDSKS